MTTSSDILPLPANLDAERYVLGSILLDDTLYGQVSQALTADDFSIEKHRRIFLRMDDVHGRGRRIDRVTIAEELHRQGQLESVDGLGYIVSLDDGLPQIQNLDSYVRIVQDKAILRRAIHTAREIEQRAMGAARPEELTEALASLVSGFAPPGIEPRPISAADLAARTPVDQLLGHKREHGLTLPWMDLDRYIGGLRPGQLILLAGHTSQGKTSLALQIAAKAAMDTGVVYFSLEMEPLALFRRMMVQRSHVDSSKWRQGALDDQERRSVQASATWVSELQIGYDERAHTVPGIISSIRRAKSQGPLGLVVVDYLQLLTGLNRYESRAQEVGGLARQLKLAAQEFEIPVILLSQFRRPPQEIKPRHPEMHDLKESGDIENHADVVLLIRPHLDQPKTQSPRSVDLHIAKQREGPSGVDVPLLFFREFQGFEARVDTYGVA